MLYCGFVYQINNHLSVWCIIYKFTIMSLDRKKTQQNKCSKPHHSLDEPTVAFESSKNFLSLSPENLNLNRSCQQLDKCNHHHHHGARRNELVTRTSTESKDTDSSSGSKKHGHRSRSPSHGRKSPSR